MIPIKKKLIVAIQILLVICILFSGYKIGSYYLAGRKFDKEHAELRASINEKQPAANKSEENPVEPEQGAGEKPAENKSGESSSQEKASAPADGENGGESLQAKGNGPAEGKGDGQKRQEEASETNFMAQLKAKYPDMVGWITIEGTDIDFPVVQGKDNDFYLNHTYKGEYHPFGEVFMDKDDKPDYSDQNTVFYGHNVRSGHVFHDLEQYKEQTFRDAHPYIEIDTVDGKKTYEVVAVYTASAYDPYRKPNYSEEEWEKFRTWVKGKNRIKESLPDREGRILTLSTCSDEEDRLVVHAVLKD